ncbi:MAG: MaoC family dehydratase [Lewinella sp.]|jgi:acyl dehydratase|nr:MaoC family dehydratase [Lewinella sp.]
MTMMERPYKTVISHLSDLPKYVGRELGLSEWLTITQEDINVFAKLTGDEQWIHVDPVRAGKESPYGTTIAHGFMILSYASKFSYETLEIGDVRMGLNYGLDKLRFTSPTPVGSQVRGRVTLLEVEAKPPGVKYKLSIVFEREGQEKPVCVAEWLAMAYAA